MEFTKNGIRRLPKVSSRNWRNLGEPTVANETEWAWSRRQEWAPATSPAVEVQWSQDRPEIRIKLSNQHPDNAQLFKADDAGELLGKVVNAYANLYLLNDKLKRENKRLRQEL